MKLHKFQTDITCKNLIIYDKGRKSVASCSGLDARKVIQALQLRSLDVAFAPAEIADDGIITIDAEKKLKSEDHPDW